MEVVSNCKQCHYQTPAPLTNLLRPVNVNGKLNSMHRERLKQRDLEKHTLPSKIFCITNYFPNCNPLLRLQTRVSSCFTVIFCITNCFPNCNPLLRLQIRVSSCFIVIFCFLALKKDAEREKWVSMICSCHFQAIVTLQQSNKFKVKVSNGGTPANAAASVVIQVIQILFTHLPEVGGC